MRGEAAPSYGPGTLYDYCVICGARYFEYEAKVPSRGELPERTVIRIGINHNNLHLSHIGDPASKPKLQPVKRTFGERDDDD